MDSEPTKLLPFLHSEAATGSQHESGSPTIQIIPAKKAARRRRILFMAEGITMTHFVRPAYLAETLDPSEWEIHFWTPKRYHPLIHRSVNRIGDLRTIDPHDFLDDMAHGRVMYSAQALNDYVQQDLEILRKVQPDLVIGDFRLSLAVSAPLMGVPFASIFNAYWSPAYKRPAVVNELPITHWVSPRLLARALPVVQPIIEALHTKPINDTRRAYGLPILSKSLSDMYTAGDLVLYPDVPGFVPLENLPPHHHFIGTCPWSAPGDLPPWWNEVMNSPRPKILVSLGSSGPLKALPAILEAASELPVEVLLTTSGRSVVLTRPGVHVADLLPYEETAKRSAIVVSHGGTSALYPALAGGAPMLAIPSNYDTHLSTDRLVKLGVGLSVRAEEATLVNIRRALKELLEEPKYKQAAMQWSHRIAAVDTKTLFPDLLRQWFSASSSRSILHANAKSRAAFL